MKSVDSFSEPRAWALQWEGAALWAEVAPRQEDVKVGEGRFYGQAVALPAVGALASRNGNGASAWPEPNSWALAWDSAALGAEAALLTPAAVVP